MWAGCVSFMQEKNKENCATAVYLLKKNERIIINNEFVNCVMPYAC